MMIRENRTNISPNRRIKGADSQLVMEAQGRDMVDNLKKWQEDYCGSCKTAQERLLEGRHLTFG